MLLLAPLLDRRVLVPANRRKLWSKRRTVAVAAVGAWTVLGCYALLLGALKFSGMG